MRVLSILGGSTVLGLAAASALAAGPTDLVTVTPPPSGVGESFSPGIRLVADLEQAYTEEEFLVSGAATLYTYNETAVPGEIVPLDNDVPYTTRIIIRRPTDPAAFNGTVMIEWWNSTATFDTAPTWDPAAEYIARKGIVYVGVTNSTTSITHLTSGCSLFGILPPTCGTRYASLSIPENGVAFEMVSQIANMLKTAAAPNPLFPDYPVERIFHAGQSQQGGSMVTYATAFHFAANDGYFVQAAGSARAINSQCACEQTNPDVCVPDPYPACTPTLQGSDRRVTTDLLVPVYRAQTGTDMAGVLAGDSRQSDAGTFRYYEMPGVAHSTVHKDIEVLPAGLLGPGAPAVFLEDLCAFQINTSADGPIFGSYLYNAMWENMERQVRFGVAPPAGDLIEVTPGNEVALDEFGNALGGIRLPQMDVPVATYGPNNEGSTEIDPSLQGIGNLACRLSGTVIPFDASTLSSLYPTEADLIRPLAHRTTDLVNARFLLPEDAVKLVPAVSSVGSKQRNCVKQMLLKGISKGGVLGKQNGANRKCVSDAGKGKLAGETAEQCVLADSKVTKAADKVTKLESSKCLADPAQLPVFGYPGEGGIEAPIISGAGKTQSLALLDDVFGTALDAAIIDAGTNPDGQKCQADAIKRINQVAEEMLKAAIGAADSGLAGGSVLTPGAMHQALATAIDDDTSSKIAKRLTKLEEKLDDNCVSADVDLSVAFPGACNTAVDAQTLASCLTKRARCHACLAWNIAADLGAACDRFDDGVGDNLTCEPTLQ